jgi:hypothetical protein
VPNKLFELVEDARLESLEDHAVRSFNLSVGCVEAKSIVLLPFLLP